MRSQILILTLLLAGAAWAQQSPGEGHQGVQGDMSNMKGMPSGTQETGNQAGATIGAMQSMEGHMDMGPHMKMTELRPVQPGDAERAQNVAQVARTVAEKYVDYHTALAGGFRIFHPEIPQKIYHFVKYQYAREAAFTFNPEHPPALLYEKHGENYTLAGVMYTAPRRFSEDELNQRIPLSIAQWHEHVNLCAPPPGRGKELVTPHPQFGLRGSIATQQACDAAGGTFYPVVFNWMVHLYPFEKDQASIWSVDRQRGDAQ